MEEERNKEFGLLVKNLRAQKTFVDDLGEVKQWTQTTLANETGLSIKQIRNIEQGKVVKLRPFLDPIAMALGLTEVQRRDYYRQAGFVYEQSDDLTSRRSLYAILRQLNYPTTVRNQLWDLLAINAFHRELWGYDQGQLIAMEQGPLGSNLLRLLFDPIFDVQNSRRRSQQNWKMEAVLAFRSSSRRHVSTKRYNQIVQNMIEFPEFSEIWQSTENVFNYAATDPREPNITEIEHPTCGTIQLVSLRLPQRYMGMYQDFSIVVGVPVATSEENYREFHHNLPGREVHMFGDQLWNPAN